MSKAKTDGLEWLTHSLMAFNGSGYADMRSPTDFLESYIAYKTMHRKPEAVSLAQKHRQDVLPILAGLLKKTNGANHRPPQKQVERLQATRQQSDNQVELL